MIQPGDIVIGIDLGGTNVRVSAVTPDGQIRASEDQPIEADRGPQHGVDKIANLVQVVCEEAGPYTLRGIGIGSTGPIDRELGAIQNPYTLPGWENVDIVRPLSERFSVPVTLENDADVAALGEHWMGAGQGMERMAAVTVGTGIGTALIVNGNIYRGIGGLHGEAGHHILDPHGPPCYCGANGCWEQLAAGPAIAEFAQQRARTTPTQMLDLAGGLKGITAATVMEAARLGDHLAQAIVDQTALYLGLGLVNVILFYMPDGIVLSGGVMQSFDLLEAGIRAVIARHDKMAPSTQVKILLSTLGRQAGVFGAARAILNEIESGVK